MLTIVYNNGSPYSLIMILQSITTQQILLVTQMLYPDVWMRKLA